LLARGHIKLDDISFFLQVFFWYVSVIMVGGVYNQILEKEEATMTETDFRKNSQKFCVAKQLTPAL